MQQPAEDFENNGGINSASEFAAMDPKTKETVLDWIFKYCMPRKTVNTYQSSYGLKHILEHDLKLYLGNGQFKGAMVAAGYEPVDRSTKNWCFRIRRVFDPRIGSAQKSAYNPRPVPEKAKR